MRIQVIPICNALAEILPLELKVLAMYSFYVIRFSKYRFFYIDEPGSSSSS